MRSEVGRRLQTEQAAADLQARRALVEELEGLRDEMAIKIPALADAERMAAERVSAAEHALAEANAALLAAQRARWAAGSELDLRVRRVEHQLETTASPAVATFLRELEADVERTRAARVVSPGEQNRLSGQWLPGRSNAESVDRRIYAICEARRAARGLMYVALTPEDVDQRIEALRAGLPSVSIHEEGL